MVRNYKRKTQSDIDENAMKKAVAEVLTGAETATSAGKKYNIKRQTIKSRVKKKQNCSAGYNTIYQSKFTSRKFLRCMKKSN